MRTAQVINGEGIYTFEFDTFFTEDTRTIYNKAGKVVASVPHSYLVIVFDKE